MDDVKRAFASKTIWAAIITGLVPLFALAGIALTPEDQATLVAGLAAVGSLVGTIATIYSRAKATARIGGVMTADPSKAPAAAQPVAPSIIRP